MSTRRIVSATGALLFPAFAAAVPITITTSYSQAFSLSAPLSVNDGFASGGHAVALSRFDPSLGTLLSAQIGVIGDVTYTFAIQATFSGDAQAVGFTEVSHAGELLDRNSGPPMLVSCAAIPGTRDPTCGAATTHGSTFAGALTYTDPFRLSDLTGPGTFNIGLQGNFLLSNLGGFNLSMTMDAFWSGSASVTYTYETMVDDSHSVDEPGSMALLTAGLLLAGALRRRRSRDFQA